MIIYDFLMPLVVLKCLKESQWVDKWGKAKMLVLVSAAVASYHDEAQNTPKKLEPVVSGAASTWKHTTYLSPDHLSGHVRTRKEQNLQT